MKKREDRHVDGALPRCVDPPHYCACRYCRYALDLLARDFGTPEPVKNRKRPDGRKKK